MPAAECVAAAAGPESERGGFVELLGRGENAVDVHGVAGHQQFAARAAPAVARAVGVHLVAQSVRVVEVERFAHEVVAGAEVYSFGGQVVDERPEARAVGEQQRVVV